MDIKQQVAFKPLKIVATADHINSLTQASALGAISELIWNGFDASSQRVDISYTFNKMDGLAGQFDYLIVELKRPSQKINDDVIVQLKKYATAVATDERFHNVPARWTFLAISNELDSYAEDEANQRDKPKGQIHDSSKHNITVWVKTWSEIISNARAKLQFINQHLEYKVNQDSSKKYLEEMHKDFIPSSKS